MSSQFSERLDFLMSLTNTTNSALARELSFDASYISRIRNGKRGMPLHQPFVDPAATYLASRVREPYQIQTVEQTLQIIGGWPTSTERRAQIIASWLTDNTATLETRFDQLVESLNSLPIRTDAAEAQKPPIEPRPVAPACTTTRYFIGNQGKRNATELFLSELIATGEPQNLFVYSDEDLGWFAEDPTYIHRWKDLMMQIIAAGGSVTIVHTITRDIGEMLDAVSSWLPLYLTGRITSYYCPRIRDGICRRTLFVASGTAAVSSNSIENATDNMATAIISEPDIVNAYEQELSNLLALCRPLVNVSACSSDLLHESDGATFAATNPISATHVGHLDLPIVKQSRLPEDVIAFVNENEGFTLVHVSEPRIAMRVSERLLTASFTEYLR